MSATSSIVYLSIMLNIQQTSEIMTRGVYLKSDGDELYLGTVSEILDIELGEKENVEEISKTLLPMICNAVSRMVFDECEEEEVTKITIELR